MDKLKYSICHCTSFYNIKFIILISSCVIITGSLVIFPFLPFMISDFFPELDRTEIGKKAGFLGSAYYIGSFAGSLMVSYY